MKMKTEPIDWHEFDSMDAETYPDKGGRYLILFRTYSDGLEMSADDWDFGEKWWDSYADDLVEKWAEFPEVTEDEE